MKVFTESAPLREHIKQWRSNHEHVALVPTMGHLHTGHASLIQQAKSLAPKVLVSIFVNPLQFNQTTDFKHYPRTLASDIGTLTALNVDAVFTPNEHELYPHGTTVAPRIVIPELGSEFCGRFRPGHFEGVCTVVAKLFNITTPDIAIFGNKDYQQLLMIRRMVEDLNFNIEIVAGETERESDGLALSSRNTRLNPQERKLAIGLFATLCQVKDEFSLTNISSQEHSAIDKLKKCGFKVEYLNLRDASNLQPITNSTKNIMVLAAVWLGDTRLIDNILFPIS